MMESPPSSSASTSGRRRFLLTVALQIWDSPKLQDLPGMNLSAEELREIFRDDTLLRLYRDTRLNDDEATKANILEALDQIAGDTGTTDQFIFYYGGHGVRRRGRRDRSGYYLVPYDGEPASIGSSCISMKELGEALSRIAASEIVLILDCCHAGGASLIWNADLLNEVTEGWKNVYVMAASGPRSPAYVHSEQGSIFGRAVAQALRDRTLTGDREGCLSAQLVWSRADTLARDAMADAGLKVVHPVSSGHGEGLLLIQARPTLPNPYKGLDAFEADDVDRFYGRDRDLDRLFEGISEHSFFLLTGESGCGKTSLLQAGLLGQLQRRGEWRVELIRFGNADPTLDVTRAMQSILGDLDPAALDNGSTPVLREISTALEESVPAEHRVLLILDQFEQVFVEAKDQHAKTLLSWIDEVAGRRSVGRVRLLVGLRLDFYYDFAREVRFTGSQQFTLGQIEGEALRQVIERPLPAGRHAENGLIEVVRNDMQREGAAGEVALLQHALYQLWEKDETLSPENYREIGGLGGALHNHAEDRYQLLRSTRLKETVRRIFLNLIQLDEKGRATRLTRSREELLKQLPAESAGASVLELLLDSRLLRTRGSRSDDPGIEIAHEILLNKWSRLGEWIAENAEFLRWKQELKPFRRQWQSYEPGGLLGWDKPPYLSGVILDESGEWLKRQPDDISPEDREFIRKSLRSRSFRMWRWAVSYVAVILLGIALAVFGYRLWYSGTDEHQISQILVAVQTLPVAAYDTEDWGRWVEARARLNESFEEMRIPESLRGSESLLWARSARQAAASGKANTARDFADNAVSRMGNTRDSVAIETVRTWLILAETYRQLEAPSQEIAFLERARNQLGRIEDRHDRTLATMSLIAQEFKGGRIGFEHAMAQLEDSIAAVEEEVGRIQAQLDPRVEVAREFAARGRFEEAFVYFLGELKAPNLALELFGAVADSGIGIPEQAGDLLDRTLGMIRQMLGSDRSDQLAFLERYHRARLGLLEEPLDPTLPITDPFYRTRASVWTAHALADRGQPERAAEVLENAVETARQISEPVNQSTVFVELAGRFAHLGNLRRARELAAMCQDRDKLRAYAEIVLEYAQVAEANR